MVSCTLAWLQICCVAEDDFDFLILLPPCPECGDCSTYHLAWFCVVLGF